MDATDFFATAASTNKPLPKAEVKPPSKKAEPEVKKRKSPDVEFHDDADFAALLVAMDSKESGKAKVPLHAQSC